MNAIYAPRGPALEYSPLACNLYAGCTHGCRYCYVPACLRKSPAQFRVEAAVPRPGILAALRKDAPKHAGQRVLLCFTSDPYQHGDTSATREAITILGEAGCVPVVLTKGGARSFRDLDLLRQYGGWYGVTAHCVDERIAQGWEPNAAPVAERMAVLAEAHAMGIKTWVSVEPVIHAGEALALIGGWNRSTVTVWTVGKLNHAESAVDWRDFAYSVVALADLLKLRLYVKKDLARYLGEDGMRYRNAEVLE